MSWYNSNATVAVDVLNGITLGGSVIGLLSGTDEWKPFAFFFVFEIIMFIWYHFRLDAIERDYIKDPIELNKQLENHKITVFHVSLIPYYIAFLFLVGFLWMKIKHGRSNV